MSSLLFFNGFSKNISIIFLVVHKQRKKSFFLKNPKIIQ